jgi:4-amino-4-deoxy-L-arabinose transferase-like glycosyltransferase
MKKVHWLFIALALLTVLLRLPSLDYPLDNDSSAILYHGRLIVRGDPLYGFHHPGHQMPGPYYAGAWTVWLFGDSAWALKAQVLLWVVLTTALVYRLGLEWRGKWVGALAALFHSMLSSHLYLMGQTAEIELFANLPRVAGILLLYLFAVKGNLRSRKMFWVGLAGAVALLFKPVYFAILAMTGMVLLGWRLSGWATPRQSRVGMATFWVGLGFTLPFVVVVGCFARHGVLDGFLSIFTLGQEYLSLRSTTTSLLFWMINPLLGLAFNNAVLLSFALLAAVGSVVRARRFSRPGFQQVAQALYVTTWFVFSYLEANVSRSGFLHYYLLLVPPLSLLAASFLKNMHDNLRGGAERRGRRGHEVLVAFALVFALGVSVAQNANYYRHYVGYRLGEESLEEFVLEGWPALGKIVVRVAEVARYVEERTSPSDRVYYWSNDVQLYYLADRRSAIDTLWPIEVEATGPAERIFASQTKYIVIGDNIPTPDWLYQGLDEHGYELEAVIEGQEVYRRP